MTPSWLLETQHLILTFRTILSEILMLLSARMKTLMLVLAVKLHLWIPC